MSEKKYGKQCGLTRNVGQGHCVKYITARGGERAGGGGESAYRLKRGAHGDTTTTTSRRPLKHDKNVKRGERRARGIRAKIPRRGFRPRAFNVRCVNVNRLASTRAKTAGRLPSFGEIAKSLVIRVLQIAVRGSCVILPPSKQTCPDHRAFERPSQEVELY